MNGANKIPITVKLFAQYREAIGKSEITMLIPDSSSVRQVLEIFTRDHPNALFNKSTTVVAVNQSYVDHGCRVHANDEVALIPPVSGGSMQVITTEKLDAASISKSLRSEYNGSVLCFEGIARKYTDGNEVIHLEYEAYMGMAEKLINQISDEAKTTFEIDQAIIQHRVGIIRAQETSLIVCVSSPHRKASFEALPWIVDKIKTDVPIWKKEVFENRQAWVACETEHPLKSM